MQLAFRTAYYLSQNHVATNSNVTLHSFASKSDELLRKQQILKEIQRVCDLREWHPPNQREISCEQNSSTVGHHGYGPSQVLGILLDSHHLPGMA